MKKLLAVLLALVLVSMPALGISASAEELNGHISVTGYDPDVNYMDEMIRALLDGGPYAIQMGAIFEQQRNLKIDGLQMKYAKTSYFTDYTTAEEILAAMNGKSQPSSRGSEPDATETGYAEPAYSEPSYAEPGSPESGYSEPSYSEPSYSGGSYSEDDVDLLARIINAEAGCDWMPDWVQQMVGSVVLNRVNSEYFPDTIQEVVYQPGQYGPVYNGMIDNPPSQRALDNARYVLDSGSICPGNVTGQSGAVSGSGVYTSYYDSVLDTTMYFCYT